MSTTQIFVFLSVALDLLLIIAYIELHAVAMWYKKQFNSKPHAFRYIEKYSWQRRLVNFLLLRKPVAIKQPFKLIGVKGKKLIRTET
jgi:hypothetical protein